MVRKNTKVKIKIQDKSYNVPIRVKEAIELLTEVVRAHEVALLTWAHKIHNKQAFDAKDKKAFHKAMYEYSMRIPNSEEILDKMESLDKKAKEQELKEEKNVTDTKS